MSNILHAITNISQLQTVLFQNKINTIDFTYNDDPEKNKYGIKDIPPLQNPALWAAITIKGIKEAIRFLIEYKKEWINPGIMNSIISVVNIDNKVKLSDKLLSDLFDATIENIKIHAKENTIPAIIDQMLMSAVQTRSLKILKLLVTLLEGKKIDINQDGIFIEDSLAEAAKSNDMKLISYIEEKFPNTLKKCESWPYLTAMKYGFYDTALHFAKAGNDIHAKNDLGYKLIERNDTKMKDMVLKGKDKEAHDFLMDVYRGNAYL